MLSLMFTFVLESILSLLKQSNVFYASAEWKNYRFFFYLFLHIGISQTFTANRKKLFLNGLNFVVVCITLWYCFCDPLFRLTHVIEQNVSEPTYPMKLSIISLLKIKTKQKKQNFFSLILLEDVWGLHERNG